MKSLKVADIVPLRVLLRIATRVVDAAMEIASAKNVPIEKGSMSISTPRTTQATTTIDILMNDVFAAYEWGSGIHRKSKVRGAPAKYPIVATNYPTLQFNGTNGYPPENPGGIIRIEKVMHPGVAPRPFLEPAKRKTREQNLEDIRKASVENIKLQIRGMARKV